MNILSIELMLHYASKPCDHHVLEGVKSGWPQGYVDAVESLLIQNMLQSTEKEEPKFEITKRGECYVEFLKSVPLPSSVTRYEVVMPQDSPSKSGICA